MRNVLRAILVVCVASCVLLSPAIVLPQSTTGGQLNQPPTLQPGFQIEPGQPTGQSPLGAQPPASRQPGPGYQPLPGGPAPGASAPSQTPSISPKYPLPTGRSAPTLSPGYTPPPVTTQSDPGSSITVPGAPSFSRKMEPGVTGPFGEKPVSPPTLSPPTLAPPTGAPSQQKGAQQGMPAKTEPLPQTKTAPQTTYPTQQYPAKPYSQPAPPLDALQKYNQQQQRNLLILQQQQQEKKRREDAQRRYHQQRAIQEKERARSKAKSNLGYDDVAPQYLDDSTSAPPPDLSNQIQGLGAAIRNQKEQQVAPPEQQSTTQQPVKAPPPEQQTPDVKVAGDEQGPDVQLAAMKDEDIDEAADELQDDADEELEKLLKELEEALEELEDHEEQVEDELERRGGEGVDTDRERRLEMEEDIAEEGEEIDEAQDDLDERRDNIEDRKEQLDEDERQLRENEQEAKRDDPNCRGPYCRAIREELEDLQKERQQLEKDLVDIDKEQQSLNNRKRAHQERVDELEDRKDRGWGMEPEERRIRQAEKELQERLDRLRPEMDRVNGQIDDIESQRGDLQDQLDDLEQQGRGDSRAADRLRSRIGRMDKALDQLGEQKSELDSLRNRSVEDFREKRADALGLGDEYRETRDTYRDYAKDRYKQGIANDLYDEARQDLRDQGLDRDLNNQEKRILDREIERRAEEWSQRATESVYDFGENASEGAREIHDAFQSVNDKLDQRESIRGASNETLRDMQQVNQEARNHLGQTRDAIQNGGEVPEFAKGREAARVGNDLENVRNQRQDLRNQARQDLDAARGRVEDIRQQLDDLGASENPNATYTGSAENRARVEDLQDQLQDARRDVNDVITDYQREDGALGRQQTDLEGQTDTLRGASIAEPFADRLDKVRSDYGLDADNQVDRDALARQAGQIKGPLGEFIKADAGLQAANEEYFDLVDAEQRGQIHGGPLLDYRKNELTNQFQDLSSRREAALDDLEDAGVPIAPDPSTGMNGIDGQSLTPVERAAVGAAFDGVKRDFEAEEDAARARLQARQDALRPKVEPAPLDEPAPGPMTGMQDVAPPPPPELGVTDPLDTPVDRPTGPFAGPEVAARPQPIPSVQDQGEPVPREQVGTVLGKLDREYFEYTDEIESIDRDLQAEDDPAERTLLERRRQWLLDQRKQVVDEARGLGRRVEPEAPPADGPGSQTGGELAQLEAQDQALVERQIELDQQYQNVDPDSAEAQEYLQQVDQIQAQRQQLARRQQQLRQQQQAQQGGQSALTPDQSQAVSQLARQDQALQQQFEELEEQYQNVAPNSEEGRAIYQQAQQIVEQRRALRRQHQAIVGPQQDPAQASGQPSVPSQVADELAQLEAQDQALVERRIELDQQYQNVDPDSAEAQEYLQQVDQIQAQRQQIAQRHQALRQQYQAQAPSQSGGQPGQIMVPTEVAGELQAIEEEFEALGEELQTIQQQYAGVDPDSTEAGEFVQRARVIQDRRRDLARRHQGIVDRYRGQAQAPQQTPQQTAVPPEVADELAQLDARDQALQQQLEDLEQEYGAATEGSPAQAEFERRFDAIWAQREELAKKRAALLRDHQFQTASAAEVPAQQAPRGRVVDGQPEDTEPIRAANPRDVYQSSVKSALETRFGSSNLIDELVAPQVTALADALGPALVNGELAKLIGDDDIRDPLALLDALGQSALTAAVEDGLPPEEAAVASVQYRYGLLQSAGDIEGVSDDTLAAMESRLRADAEYTIDMLQDAAIDAEAEGDMVREASLVADLIAIHAMAGIDDAGLQGALDRARQLVGSIRKEYSELPPDTPELVQGLDAASQLVDALQSAGAAFGGDKPAAWNTALQRDIAAANFLASSTASRLHGHTLGLDDANPQATQAVSELARDFRIAGIDALIAGGQYAQALSQAEDTGGFAERSYAIIHTTGRLLDLYPRLDEYERRGLGSADDLRAKRFEALQDQASREQDPVRKSALASRLAGELADEGRFDEAQQALDFTLENIRGEGDEAFLARATLHGAKLAASLRNPAQDGNAASLVQSIPEDMREGAVGIALSQLGSGGHIAALDDLAGALPDSETLALQHNQATIQALLQKPATPQGDERLRNSVERGRQLVESATRAGFDGKAAQNVSKRLDAVEDYLDKVDGLKAGLRGDAPEEGYISLAQQALSLGRWEIARESIEKHLGTARVREGAEILGDSFSLIEQMLIRSRMPGEEDVRQVAASTESKALALRALRFAEERIERLQGEIGNSERTLFRMRKAEVSADDIELIETGRQRMLAEVRRLSALRARLMAAKDGTSPGTVAGDIQARIDDTLRTIRENYSGIGELDDDNAVQHESLRAALGELNALRAQRDGVMDLIIASSGPDRNLQDPGSGIAQSRLERELANLDTALNGRRGARNDFLAASNTRRYFETFGEKDEDRIRDLIISGHEVEYLESRRYQMIMGTPIMSMDERRELFTDVLDREARSWEAAADEVSPLLEIYGIGRFDRDRASAQRNLIASLPQQFLVSDLVEEFESKRESDPQAAFESLARLQQMNLTAQRDIYLAYLAGDDEASWYDRGLIKSNIIALGHSGNLEEFEQLANEMGELHGALIQAAYHDVEELTDSDREILESRGFIKDGAYVVPDGVTVDPVELGTQLTDESAWYYTVDRFTTPKEILILGATVVLPGGMAARVARAGGAGFFRSAAAYRATASILAEAFGQGVSRAALSQALKAGLSRNAANFLARWAGEKAVEGAFFTAYSRLANAAIDPSLLLTGEFYDPLGLAEEFVHNVAVLGALGATGSAYGRAQQALARRLEEQLVASALKRDIFRVLAGTGLVASEASVLTAVNQVLTESTFSQESFAGNAAVVLLLKGYHAAGNLASPSGGGRVSQTRDVMARYNQWLDSVHLPVADLMGRFRGSWNAVRAAYQRGQELKQLQDEYARKMTEFEQSRQQGTRTEQELADLARQLDAMTERMQQLLETPLVSEDAMAGLVAYRKQVVDAVAAEIVSELGGDVQAFGSTKLTSDYDISFTGPKAELAQILFASRMRSGWGEAGKIGGYESARTLDTNAYTDPIFDRFTGGPEDVRFQDGFANLAARKYLSNEAWSQYRDWVLANAPEGKRADVESMLNSVERMHTDFEARVEAKKEELRSEQSKELFGDRLTEAERAEHLDILARNLLYEESLQRVMQLMESHERAGEDGKSRVGEDIRDALGNGRIFDSFDLVREYFAAGPERQAELAQQLRNAQSEALYFAAEAYFTEAAISHVVGTIQAAGREITIETLMGEKPLDLSIPLTPAQGRQSYVEQIGNMYKEIDHAGSAAKLGSKGAKYMLRALDASVIAGLELGRYRDFVELVLNVEANRSDLTEVQRLLTEHYGEGNERMFLADLASLERVLTAFMFGDPVTAEGEIVTWAREASEDFAVHHERVGDTARFRLEMPLELVPIEGELAEAPAAPAEPALSRTGENVPRWKALAPERAWVKEQLVDMGWWSDFSAEAAAAIQLVQNGKTTTEAIIIAAFQRGYPPDALMSRLGVSEGEVRRTLDTYLETNRKLAGADARGQLIDNYVSGRKTDSVLNRSQEQDSVEVEYTTGPDGKPRLVIRLDEGGTFEDTQAFSRGERTTDSEATADFTPAPGARAGEVTVGGMTGSEVRTSPVKLRILGEELQKRGYGPEEAQRMAEDMLSSGMALQAAIDGVVQGRYDPVARADKADQSTRDMGPAEPPQDSRDMETRDMAPPEAPEVQPGRSTGQATEEFTIYDPRELVDTGFRTERYGENRISPDMDTRDAPGRPEGPPQLGSAIRRKIMENVEARLEAEQRIEDYKEQALDDLGRTEAFGELVRQVREGGDPAQEANLSLVGILRNSLSAEEAQRADEAWRIARQVAEALPEDAAVDLVALAKYVTNHAGRVDPQSPSGLPSLTGGLLSERGLAASLAAEALLNAGGARALDIPAFVAASGLNASETSQALRLANGFVARQDQTQ